MPLFDDSLFDGGGTPFLASPPDQPPGYLGRFQLGQNVPLSLVTADRLGFPVPPTATPTATIVGPDTNTVATVKLAMVGDDSHFGLPFFLGIQLLLGTYQVTYSYHIGAQSFTVAGSFDVIPGGDPGGAIISLISYDRPEARFVVAQLTSGRLVQGRNPRFT